jgi:hypothetical protein
MEDLVMAWRNITLRIACCVAVLSLSAHLPAFGAGSGSGAGSSAAAGSAGAGMGTGSGNAGSASSASPAMGRRGIAPGANRNTDIQLNNPNVRLPSPNTSPAAAQARRNAGVGLAPNGLPIGAIGTGTSSEDQMISNRLVSNPSAPSGMGTKDTPTGAPLNTNTQLNNPNVQPPTPNKSPAAAQAERNAGVGHAPNGLPIGAIGTGTSNEDQISRPRAIHASDRVLDANAQVKRQRILSHPRLPVGRIGEGF